MMARLTGRLVQAATAPAYRRFLRSMRAPQHSQQRVLEALIKDGAASRYGEHHDLQPGDGEAAFRSKVPIASYDDLRPWIDRAVFGGERGVLSPHPVVRVEATSGSSAGVKWIPYTRPMMATFSRMFALWSHDLLRFVYRPRTGRLFMCVTGGRPHDGTLPHQLIGDDRDYLGTHWRRVLDRFVIAPEFGGGEDPLARLGETLAGAGDLEVMSFWSPSLLVAVLDHLGIDDPGDIRRFWPRLQLISCWTAGSSELFMGRLRRLFSEVRFQGKGLLATEAAVTMPLESAGGCVPLLDDVYLEFLRADGSVLGLHELDAGGEYEVLTSNRSGLLRYRLGDRVRVSGFQHRTPMLEFLGRAGIVSDLVGEKMSLAFVERELSPAVGSYYCLVPASKHYELWLDGSPRARADRLEGVLCRNFQYAKARSLGQLGPLVVEEADHLAERVRRCLEGEEAGSAARAFKPPVLVADREKARRISRGLRRRQPERRA